MNPRTWAPRVAVVLIAVGTLAASATAVCGIVLARTFRPHAAVDSRLLPEAVQRSDRWSDWHQVAAVVFLVAAAAAVPLVVVSLDAAKATVRRRSVVIAASGTAVLLAILTLATRALVQWDQLALRSVTVGGDRAGYWLAGFDDDVVFVLIDGTEVSQGDYVSALLTHLAAPIAGAVALVAVAVGMRHRFAAPPPED